MPMTNELSASTAARGAIPEHVPPELVFEYEEALAPTTLDDIYAPAWEVFKTYPPVFYARSQLAISDVPGNWVATHYEDIREVFQNTERYSSQGIFTFHKLVGESFTPIPITLDPPEHDKYRIFLNPWFSPKAVDKLDNKIRATVNALIDGFVDKGECDVSFGFGRIYPVKVFMGLMGFPDEKFEEFLSWGYAMLHEMNNLERVRWGAKSALTYLRSFIEEVRKNPGDNLTSRIVHGEIAGQPLTDDEIIGIVFFLWTGGLDTVAATNALMFRRLALDPQLQENLRQNPEVLREAVEEFLRMNPTVNSARVAKVDHELHGVKIKKGDRVICLIAAGNYDPAEFDDPRNFRAERSPNRHVTFIAGPHRCLGSNLARRELHIALGEFLRRIPPFRLKPGADRRAVPGLIAMPHLPLQWEVTARI
jgi:cytochrome P450